MANCVVRRDIKNYFINSIDIGSMYGIYKKTVFG